MSSASTQSPSRLQSKDLPHILTTISPNEVSYPSHCLMEPPTFRHAITVLIWWRQSSPRQQYSHLAMSSSVGRKKAFCDPTIPGSLCFISHDGLLSMHFPLCYHDGLYYCDTDVYTVDRNPVCLTCARTNAIPTCPQPHRPAPKFVPTMRARQVESEVWALCFGSPGEGQLDALPHHVDGIPPVFEYHPFRHIDFKEQASIRKQPAWKSAERLPDCGSEFFMDFGFMRTSHDDYRCPNKTSDWVVQSYDGYSAYLLIVDGASCRVWVFLTLSKTPPLQSFALS